MHGNPKKTYIFEMPLPRPLDRYITGFFSQKIFSTPPKYSSLDRRTTELYNI